MAIEEIESGQETFLREGGVFAPTLRHLRKLGAISRSYTYQEYPKVIRLSKGIKKTERSTETVDKKTLTWTEEKEAFEDIIVNSEDEEERVLSGGKTSYALEEERQAMIIRCRNSGIRVDPSWSSLRLRRELGDKLNEEPKDDMGTLKKRLAELEEMAAMRDRIAELEARMSMPVEAPPSNAEADDIRGQLFALGVQVDGRWSVRRLREELERATAPDRAA